MVNYCRFHTKKNYFCVLNLININNMADQKSPQADFKPKGQSKKPLLFMILGVVAILLAIKVVLDHRERKELEAFYKTEMEAAQAKLDNISKELAEKIVEIDSLGGNIDELVEAQ